VNPGTRDPDPGEPWASSLVKHYPPITPRLQVASAFTNPFAKKQEASAEEEELEEEEVNLPTVPTYTLTLYTLDTTLLTPDTQTLNPTS
jgi:hypothetical protein